MSRIRIRPLSADASSEVEIVAERMEQTLAEVLGEERGRSMYSREWLVDRVRFHLDPARSQAQVLVAEDESGEICGHTIVRAEREDEGEPFGLFSTTYVAPEARGQGVAMALLDRGEQWMTDNGMRESATYTAEDNTKLIKLYSKRGYRIVMKRPDLGMIVLKKCLGDSLDMT